MEFKIWFNLPLTHLFAGQKPWSLAYVLFLFSKGNVKGFEARFTQSHSYCIISLAKAGFNMGGRNLSPPTFLNKLLTEKKNLCK